MREIKVAVILIAAVLTSLSASIIYADPPGPADQQKEKFIKKMDDRRQELYNNLGLTDEQRKLLEENKNKHRGETKALVAEMRQKMALLRQELEAGELNMQAISRTNNELKQLQAQMLDNRLERILEVRKILTPGQFKKFEDRMSERMEHFKDRQ